MPIHEAVKVWCCQAKPEQVMRRRDFLQKAGRFAVAAPLTAGWYARTPCVAAETDPKEPVRAPTAGPLRVHADNPRYFTDGSGKAIYLTGSHTWSNLMDMGSSDPPPRFNFTAYLEFLGRLNHNFIRMWTWESVSWKPGHWRPGATHTVAPLPFARTGPGTAMDGKPRFDLTKYDREYFDRLRSRVAAAGKQGFYVSVMLFEGWAMQFSENSWKAHPFHPANNINQIDGDVNQDGKGLEVHTLQSAKVTALQEAYVRKVIDTVGDLDNVLYEISNENHPPSTAWQYRMIDYVHRYESRKAKQHPVGMTFQYRGGSNRILFESPADWISPNHEGGYRDNPPAADGRKVILSDTDHLWGIGGNQAWVWKSFLRGLNSLFMDPYDGTVLGKRFDKKWEPVRKSLGYTLRYAQHMKLAAMRPHGELASSGYCLASPAAVGGEYLAYLPAGGKVTVDLSATSGNLKLQWFSPSTGASKASGSIEGGARRTLVGPFAGDTVLWLRGKRS